MCLTFTLSIYVKYVTYTLSIYVKYVYLYDFKNISIYPLRFEENLIELYLLIKF